MRSIEQIAAEIVGMDVSSVEPLQVFQCSGSILFFISPISLRSYLIKRDSSLKLIMMRGLGMKRMGL